MLLSFATLACLHARIACFAVDMRLWSEDTSYCLCKGFLRLWCWASGAVVVCVLLNIVFLWNRSVLFALGLDVGEDVTDLLTPDPDADGTKLLRTWLWTTSS